MFSLYFILKFLHIAAVVFWIGSIASLNILALRLTRTSDSGELVRLTEIFDYFGRRVIGPASGIVLLAGLALVYTAKIKFTSLWVLWGIAGFLFHGIVGATVLRRNGLELSRLASAPTVDRTALEAVRKKQKTIATVYLLVMLSVIWAMVAKPV